MDLNLINERYTDTQYHSYFLLKESWDTFSPSQKRFIKECEDITHSVFPELLQEGPLDKFRSKAAGAIAGAKNLGKSLTGRSSEAENVEQVKVNKRVQIFQSGVGKVLGELQRDLGKMGIQGEDHPTIQAINYINGSANQIGTAEYPIEVKAGLGGRMADKALEWTNTKIQKILTDIKAAADQEEQMEFPGMETFKLSDSIKRSAGKSLQAIESFAKKNPKWTNFSVGVIVAASRLAGVPGSGILTGLLLRSALGVIKGENVEHAVGNAAKVAAVGTVAGAAIGELGDALSDNADQVEGALDKAENAGEDAVRQSPEVGTDADPNTDFAGGTEIGSDYVTKTEKGFRLSGGIKDLIDQKADILMKDVEGVTNLNQLDPQLKQLLIQGEQRGEASSLRNAARRSLELSLRAGDEEGLRSAARKFFMKQLAADENGKFYKMFSQIGDSTFKAPNIK